ncbi:hypothetical protein AB6A40_003040 [Gnathostoma spinigerum]|uniref:Uncharacterized protein n=1 Tax=Gnathostoma spinigerum TaxID=75299 RepID=A0ABD6EG08_9BILA
MLTRIQLLMFLTFGPTTSTSERSARLLFFVGGVGAVQLARTRYPREAAHHYGYQKADEWTEPLPLLDQNNVPDSSSRLDYLAPYATNTRSPALPQSPPHPRGYGETHDILRFLRKIKYDHRQRPENSQEDSVCIQVSIVVSNIRAVSEVTMDYALELFYREQWLDERLKFKKKLFRNKSEIALHESYTNFLWHPDTFMPNAIASKNPQKESISHRSLLRLNESGYMLYSRRISIVAECPMDLTLFPFDSQVCKLGIESYGYTADKVRYTWSHGEKTALVLNKIRLPDFRIESAYVTSHTEVYATGNYSRLYVCFVFTRSSGFCFLQLIIPSTSVVITSWVALWMENETEFQDMISIILAITFLIFSYNEMMPRVSYIKAMDVYLGVCFMIVFLSLIKLAMVKFMRQRLRLTRESSLVAGLYPVLKLAQSTTANAKEHNGAALGVSHGFCPALPQGIPPNLTQITHFTQPIPYMTQRAARRSISQSRRCSRHSMNAYSSMSLADLDGCYSPARNGHNLTVEKGSFNCFFMEWTFTASTVRRFHWITQMLFFFGFVSFCAFYFIVYPTLRPDLMDPECNKELAEWYAEIP